MEVVEYKVPGDILKLSPIGDIQFGARGCDVDKLRRHIEWGNERQWYFLGMGDYLDPGSPSNRKAMESIELYDSVHDMLDDALCRMAEKLAGYMSGNWLGVIEGDHGFSLTSGEPIDHYLAGCLGTDFLGTSAFVNVYIGECPRPLRIWVFHGKSASAANPTGLTLHFQRLAATIEADIYLMGHAHQKYGVARDVLFPAKVGKTWKLKHRAVAYGATGSFLNGYQLGSESPAGYAKGSYVESAGLPPVATGALLITAEPEKRDEGWAFEIRVSV